MDVRISDEVAGAYAEAVINWCRRSGLVFKLSFDVVQQLLGIEKEHLTELASQIRDYIDEVESDEYQGGARRPEGPDWVTSVVAEAFDFDRKAAGIPKKTHVGEAVFHALRTTFCNLVEDVGRANQKEAEALPRHSSGGVLRQHYSVVQPERLQTIQEAVGIAVYSGANSRILAERKVSGLESRFETSHLDRRRGGTRTPTGFLPTDFKSVASADSATRPIGAGF